MVRIWCTNRHGIDPASSSITARNQRFGTSAAPFESFNLGSKVGDDPAAVLENRMTLARTCGLDRIIFMDQIHSAQILLAEEFVAGTHLVYENGRDTVTGSALDRDAPRCDGVFLTKEFAPLNLGLAVQVADCVPLILGSDEVIAAVHIGREGLLRGMTEAALDAVASRVAMDSLQATIGPSICGDCYPLSPDLFARCAERYPASIHSVAESKIDVAAAVISILQERGVRWQWFGGERECVYTDSNYYSYRRDRSTGRQAMVVAW